ncbi:hypothetical protein D9619_008226 [Psilocybe cf. subviscida]|uniref:Uncharacterized protein n=1 Tax=Psilocybe cf. subviscida TaxID=2480587 RepID=A0A8H5ATJ0_9AGAR|nr:hypothetical protein D9619_008226 [Psilocybe cf. subviscida]
MQDGPPLGVSHCLITALIVSVCEYTMNRIGARRSQINSQIKFSESLSPPFQSFSGISSVSCTTCAKEMRLGFPLAMRRRAPALQKWSVAVSSVLMSELVGPSITFRPLRGASVPQENIGRRDSQASNSSNPEGNVLLVRPPSFIQARMFGVDPLYSAIVVIPPNVFNKRMYQQQLWPPYIRWSSI